MENQSQNKSLTSGQIIFLTLGFPLCLLLLIELTCRVFNAPEFFKKSPQQLNLEMPTWMLEDENIKSKANLKNVLAENIDWLNIFEPGPGFRVRMIPNIEKSVSNTFSLIAEDRAVKYYIKANSLGFRGPDLSPEKFSSAFRILIFGDSSSFAWGVNQNETYAEILQQKLQQLWPEKKVEVGNFAVPGDSSEYGKLVFEKFAAAYKPDLVIFGFGANDAKNAKVSHQQQVEKFRSYSKLQNISHWTESSFLYRTLQALLEKQSAQSKAEKAIAKKTTSAVRKKRYRENLRTMSQQSIENGSRNTLLLTLCTPGDYAHVAKALADQNNYLFFNGQNYILKQLAAIKRGELHPELVQEMEARYPAALKSNELFYISSDGCHPNKLGQLLVGEKLAELIFKSVKS